MSKEKGYTLAEILTTVVILAVLAGIAIPNFTKSKEKAEADQAIAHLRTLRTSERMYFAKNSAFLACADAAAIKLDLGAEVVMNNYTFNVTAPTPTTGFRARARKGSTASTAATCTEAGTICLDQDGEWSGTYAHLPAS